MKVHELIDKPEKWLKGYLASDAYTIPSDHKLKGNIVPASSKQAKSFCFYGALLCLACKDTITSESLYIDTEWRKIEKIIGQDPVDWNNSPDLTFEEFHRVLVEADV